MQKPPNEQKPLPDAPSAAPPEEAFWHRYSPHHEFSLSSVSSVAVFGLSLGLIVLVGFLAGLARNDPSRKPPAMDVVEIEGQSGGTDGPGLLGSGPVAQAKHKAEAVEDDPQPKRPMNQAEHLTQTLKTPLRPNPLDLPKTSASSKDDDPAAALVFGQVAAEAKKEVEKVERALRQSGSGGVPNPGKGGGKGGGDGPGFGTGKGAGQGNGPTGMVLNKHQRREMRWKIDFSGSGEEHLAKLQALRVTLAFPTGRPSQYLLLDLTRARPAPIISDLAQQRNKVKWFNTDPRSLRDLARVLRLPGVPAMAVIFLPTDVEEQMQQLEHDYKGLEEHQIELTEFEIQRRGAQVVPVVIAQRQR